MPSASNEQHQMDPGQVTEIPTSSTSTGLTTVATRPGAELGQALRTTRTRGILEEGAASTKRTHTRAARAALNWTGSALDKPLYDGAVALFERQLRVMAREE